MAHAHEVPHAVGQHEEINPFSIVIKQIPLFWERDRLLQVFIHKKLPTPATLNYLCNEFGFRGIAFASFDSPDQARKVVRELDHTWVAIGRCLKVQFKKRRTEVVANLYRKHSCNPVGFSNVGAREEAIERVCEHSSRCTRQQTPPSESYELLMRYQKNPVEKEKLRKLLELTGDYGEAVNEFAKNRQRETPLRSFVLWMRVRQKHVDEFAERRSKDSYEEATYEDLEDDSNDKPILEMRSATDEDLEQIAAMEIQFGLEGAPWLPLTCKHKGEHVGVQDFGGVAGDCRLGIIT
ncbi:hypothetical protein BDR22DRAFT_818453 [Usnea florida]